MSALVAALGLARGQSDTIRDLSAEPSDVAYSFLACLVAALPMVAFRVMLWMSDKGIPDNVIHVLAHDALVTLVGWLGFVLISHRMAARTGRSALWPRFVILANWCNAIAGVLVIAGEVPRLLGVQGVVGQFTRVLAAVWALWFSWFVVRQALRTGPLLAWYFVLVEHGVYLACIMVGTAFEPRLIVAQL